MGTSKWLDAQKALAVVQELRSLGLDADVDLPRICVVGKQSSGKSSILEALTRVPFPRTAGTCTRCAFEISTRKVHEAFSCQLRLRCEGEGGCKETLSVAETHNPADVAELLKIGQRLLLNPSVLKAHWDALKSESMALKELEAVLPEENSESFTRDVVSVELCGPELDDLDLIDLPGLIQSVESDRDEPLIGLIKDLCTSYLSAPNTLIVMCCPFNDDMENQEVRKMARECDPEGGRTVGVLTKADLIDRGTEKGWIEVLQNEKFHIQHGYYATRNPSQLELNASLDSTTARQKEAEFFENHVVGRRLRGAASDRCGASNLQLALSCIFHEMLRKEFPELRAKLQKQLQEAEKTLEDLGPGPVAPKIVKKELLSILDTLTESLEQNVEAQGDGPFPFFTSVEACYQKLLQRCFNTRPHLLLEKGREPLGTSDPALAEEEASTLEDNRTTELTLLDVKDRIKKAHGRELWLPGSPASYRAACQIHQEMCQLWVSPTMECVEEVSDILLETLEKLVFEQCGGYPPLAVAVRELLQARLTERRSALHSRAREVLTRESAPDLFTQDVSLGESFEATWAAFRRAFLRAALGDNTLQRLERELIDAEVALVASDRRNDDAIWCMAVVHTFSKVALTRFCDAIPQEVDQVLLRTFVQSIKQELMDGLQVLGSPDEELCKLLVEDSRTSRHRRALEAKVDRHRQGLRCLTAAAAFFLAKVAAGGRVASEPGVGSSAHRHPLAVPMVRGNSNLFHSMLPRVAVPAVSAMPVAVGRFFVR